MSNRPFLHALLPATSRHGFIRRIALATILLGVAATPGFAAAVTYTGTLGGQAIVLELTEATDGPLLGRYSYLSRGADIPLHALGASQYDAVLAEEKPCTSALCERPDDNLVLDPPLGAQFQLHYSADGKKLTGTWRASAESNAELPVDLSRFGQRDYARDDVFPYGSFLSVNYDQALITPETSPYDYAKMQVALTEGPLQTIDGATYRDVTDPRTKFAFPRVASLAGGGDIASINATLDQRRWANNYAGFECLSRDYLGGGWMPLPFGTGGNSLGGIDRDHVSIQYLSDEVMTIRHSGSGSCGGGASYDYVDYYTYDVHAGGPLDLSRIFKDWDAASNDPTQPLVDWILAAYRKAPNYDADHAGNCSIDENMAEYLDISFAPDGAVVFLFVDSERTDCMTSLATMPPAKIKNLLTDTALDYFPSQKS